MSKEKTASFIIIGNEILSGRTSDKNLHYIATKLTDIGINLKEVRIVRDEEDKIIKATNELRNEYDYVFTCGGIGPTHDDITVKSVAEALNLPLIEDPSIRKIIQSYYKDNTNQNRYKMALIPKGATLLANKVTSVPGFKIENVFVLAGIPNIMQSMFEAAKEHLTPGPKTHSFSVNSYINEGEIAHYIGILQNKYPEIEIGSYPFKQDERFATSIVFRSTNARSLSTAATEYEDYLIKNDKTIWLEKEYSTTT